VRDVPRHLLQTSLKLLPGSSPSLQPHISSSKKKRASAPRRQSGEESGKKIQKR
jgi:hypothetical protein